MTKKNYHSGGTHGSHLEGIEEILPNVEYGMDLDRGLSPDRIREIVDYLSDIESPWGFVPEYMNPIWGEWDDINWDPFDSTTWDNVKEYAEGYIPVTKAQLMDDSNLMDMYAEAGNPELALGGNFFPIKKYPQVALDYLTDYADSGNWIDYKVPEGAAGVYRGGRWDDEGDLYKIGISPYYTEKYGGEYDDPNLTLATEAQVVGHEGLHGAIEAYKNLEWNAPYEYAYLKEGPRYDYVKKFHPNLHPPSTHWAGAAPFHPSIHAIDEMFFDNPNQPDTKFGNWYRGTTTKEQVANANHLMNYNKQINNQENLNDWQSWNDYFDTGTTHGPVGNFQGTGTTYGPVGNPHL